MTRTWIAVVLAAVMAGTSWAKLPPPTEEQKAKAEETKAKAAEAAKKDAELLGKAQDRAAERYIQAMKAKGITVTPAAIPAPAPAAAPAAAPPSAPPAPVAPVAPTAAKK